MTAAVVITALVASAVVPNVLFYLTNVQHSSSPGFWGTSNLLYLGPFLLIAFGFGFSARIAAGHLFTVALKPSASTAH